MTHFITNLAFAAVIALIGLLIWRGRESLIIGYYGRPRDPELLNVKKLCHFYGGALFVIAGVTLAGGALYWITQNSQLYLYSWYAAAGVAVAAILFINIVNPFIIKD